MTLRHHSQSGFALAEMLVSIVIVSVVLLSAVAMIFVTTDRFERILRMGNLHEQTRAAFDLLWLGGYRTGVNACTSSDNGQCSTAGDKYHNYILGVSGRTNLADTSQATIAGASLYYLRSSAQTTNGFWKVPQAYGSGIGSLAAHSTQNYLMGINGGGTPLYYLSLAPWGGSITSPAPADTELRAATLDSGLTAVTVICVDANTYPLIRGCDKDDATSINVYGYLADDPVLNNTTGGVTLRTASVSIPMIDVYGLDYASHNNTALAIGNGSRLIDVYRFYMWTSFATHAEYLSN